MRNLNYPVLLCVICVIFTGINIFGSEETEGENKRFHATLTEVRQAAPNESIACQYAATMTLTYRYSELTEYKDADLDCAREVVRMMTMD